jgi:N-acetyl-gamma-glutamyl-phosphate reductase
MRPLAINIGIVGASGYTGAELLRLCSGHPDLDIQVATSREFAGQPVDAVYPNLTTDLTFTEMDIGVLGRLDLVFLALPHGASATVASELADATCRIVDLSADFRFSDPAIYPEWFGREHPDPEALAGWVFGLPELHRDKIAGAMRVANPGCYPTSAVLALAPFVSAGAIDVGRIVVSAASGVSGAGRSASAGVHFSHVDSNLKAYGAPTHKHTPEVEQELGRLAGEPVRLTFVPHLVPMPRGLLSTAIAPYTSDADPMEILATAYGAEPFVKVTQGWPETKYTAGSNLALVSAKIDERTGNLIVCCAIDNLGKGAAGQAVQNANLMLGLDETAGLTGGGIYP